jgi:two-component system chemotaxis response regulator CheB
VTGDQVVEKRDIIVMGASAGGIEAYCEILRGLPWDLAASVFVAQHVGSKSVLADVLRRCAALQLGTAADGEGVRHGRVYVAPVGRHLLLERGRVRLSRAGGENNQRSSVDALFRSAAKAYLSRVIAVVLSGMLDDGAAGAWAVKERGGVVIVQDPRTALHSSMPENALQAIQADYCVPLAEIAGLLVKLVREDTPMPAERKS